MELLVTIQTVSTTVRAWMVTSATTAKLVGLGLLKLISAPQPEICVRYNLLIQLQLETFGYVTLLNHL